MNFAWIYLWLSCLIATQIIRDDNGHFPHSIMTDYLSRDSYPVDNTECPYHVHPQYILRADTVYRRAVFTTSYNDQKDNDCESHTNDKDVDSYDAENGIKSQHVVGVTTCTKCRPRCDAAGTLSKAADYLGLQPGDWRRHIPAMYKPRQVEKGPESTHSSDVDQSLSDQSVIARERSDENSDENHHRNPATGSLVPTELEKNETLMDPPIDICQHARQYTDGQHVYWVINGKHMQYLNGLSKKEDEEEMLLPISSNVNGIINTKYALELKLYRKVSITGIVLRKETKIKTVWFQYKTSDRSDWAPLLDNSAEKEIFSVVDGYIALKEPVDASAIRIYPVDTSGIIEYRMPSVIQCMTSEWSNTGLLDNSTITR